MSALSVLPFALLSDRLHASHRIHDSLQVTDRLKHLDAKIELKVNMAGELQLGAEVSSRPACACYEFISRLVALEVSWSH